MSVALSFFCGGGEYKGVRIFINFWCVLSVKIHMNTHQYRIDVPVIQLLVYHYYKILYIPPHTHMDNAYIFSLYQFVVAYYNYITFTFVLLSFCKPEQTALRPNIYDINSLTSRFLNDFVLYIFFTHSMIFSFVFQVLFP